MFELYKVEEKCADTCEQCESEKKPVYRLKGKYDNLDTMLCDKCLTRLKSVINSMGFEVPQGVAADMVVLTKKQEEYYVVLIERGHYPFGSAIPGGHLDKTENFKQCAIREFEEECNVKLDIEQAKLLNEYSEPEMDPRGWYVSVAYTMIVDESVLQTLKAKDDAKRVFLCNLNDAISGKVEFAFTHHKKMVEDVYKMIANK